MSLLLRSTLGTASVANGATTVILSGGTTASIQVGDMFSGGGDGRYITIASITNDTTFELEHGWPGADLADADYEVRYTSDASSVSATVRTYLAGLDAASTLIQQAAAAGAHIKATIAQLNADLTWDADTAFWVSEDMGIYRKSGASGSGSWTRVMDIPVGAAGANGIGDKFDLGLFVQGKPQAGETVCRFVFSNASAILFAAGLAASRASAGTAATGSSVFSVKKNGTQFVTIAFAAAGTTGSFTAVSDTTFNAGDVLTVVAPGTADATLADISITLSGTR